MLSFKRNIIKARGLLPDGPYVYLQFFLIRKEIPRLRHPVTYSQKINWLKLHGHLESYATYADKYTVRSYVEDRVGAEYLVPLIGAWDRFEDIPFDALPTSFVLKATHGCEYNYICKDKATIDLSALKAQVNLWLQENYYKSEREPQYKLCVPKIICEEYLEDEGGELKDYKITCTNGEPKIIQVDVDRFTNHKSYMLNIDWSPLSYASSATYPGIGLPGRRPENLQKMLSLARELAHGFPFVRVDLYSVRNKLYFGELTFTPSSGFATFSPASGDIELGKLIHIEDYSKGSTAGRLPFSAEG